MKTQFSRLCRFFGILFMAHLRLLAQPAFTDANWVSISGLPGANGPIYAIVADKNGNIYAGGSFTVIGTVVASNVARWNGSTWSALGSGISAPVNALALDSDGNLYAGGYFTSAGGVGANSIAEWNGNNWSALSSGMDYTVTALACDSAGNLYAGGQFSTAGGLSASNVAKWNGSTWSALGSGIVGGYPGVAALACDTMGNLYVGGNFDTAGGISATNIAKWNGSAWSALGSGANGGSYSPGGYEANGGVYALAFDSQGNLFAGGSFSMAGAASAINVAQWNGSDWLPVGSGISDTNCGGGTISALAFDNVGNLYASLTSICGLGSYAYMVSQWNGGAWSVLDSGQIGYASVDIGNFPLVSAPNGNLYVGGSFSTMGEVAANNIAAWDGNNWLALGGPFLIDISYEPGPLSVLAFDNHGNLYAGCFEGNVFGGPIANGIAEWNGTTWSALGSGVAYDYDDYEVNALACDSSGNLYAGGAFTTAGGLGATNVAKWNGSTWSALGAGVGSVDAGGYNSYVNTLVCDGAQNLYAGGLFASAGGVSANAIAKWDGSGWSALDSGVNGSVNALAFDTNGNLYAAGAFSAAGGVNASCIAKWNGATWSALSSGMSGPQLDNGPYVSALALDTKGILYAGGYFTSAGGASAKFIAEWNGTTWSALGSGMDDIVTALACDSAGNLYAGGQFSTAGGLSANNIAKWNGSIWSALGSGVNNWVSALAFDSTGNLYAGGFFSMAGTQISLCAAKAILTVPTPNQLLLANAGGGDNILTFLATPGAKYALDVAISLTPPVNWIPQLTNAASTNDATTAGYLTFTNSNHLPQAYYRTRSVQ
jgi:trimeric autotransporter adhesin